MKANRIAELLTPCVQALSAVQLEQVSSYLDLLLKWNSRMNLTAIRDEENIVIRHFGESFLLGRQLPPADDLMDIGSGPGFPGIPVKILRPEIVLTLVEAQQKKATFLREVLRTINVDGNVKNLRAEDLARTSPGTASVVTLRAVEKFESVLPTAAKLVRTPGPTQAAGSLAILIGSSQVLRAKELLPNFAFQPSIAIPGSENRVILVGNPVS